MNVNSTSANLLVRFQSGWFVLLVLLFVTGCAVHRGVVHEIQEGQTLWRISQVYEVELDTLLRVNDIEDPSSVRAGTDIVIPSANQVRDVPSEPQRAVRQTENSRESSELKESGDGEASSTPTSDSEGSERETGSRSTATGSEGSPSSSSSPGDSASDEEAPTQYFDPVWPCDGRLASRFKKNEGPSQRGIRIHTAEGSLVKAAEEGNIKLAGSWDKMPELGKIVIIFHSHDFTTVYAHLGSLNVSEGETVNRGQTLGTVGQTGAVDRSMCYFEVRYELEPRDPLIFLGESK